MYRIPNLIVHSLSCLLVFCVLLSVKAHSAIETSLSDEESSAIIRSEYYVDTKNVSGIDAIRKSVPDDQWEPLTEDHANFGYQDHPYWYRFTLSNPTNRAVERIIELSYPLLDIVDLYEYSDDTLVNYLQVGDRVPYNARPIEHPNFLFPIRLEANSQHDFYLRVQTEGSQLVPLKLWQGNELFIQLGKEDALHATYFGIVSVIIFFNLLIFLALREITYLYYSLAALAYMLFFAIMRAKLYPLVFSESPEFHHTLLLLLPSSCLLFSALFARAFLKPREHSVVLHNVISVIVAIAVMGLLGTFFLDAQSSLKFSVTSVLPGAFVLFLLGPILGFMGNRMAWVYTAAWSMLMAGALVTALSKQGLMPVSFVSEYGMQIGSAIELFILNAALASRFYREHKQRIAAQEAQLKEHLERREAEKKLLNKSMSDPVTSLPNRNCFEQTLHAVLENRSGHRLGVCVIEILRYPEVSRTLGHQNTELMLNEFARHLDRIMADMPGILKMESPLSEAWVCALEHGSFGMMADAEEAERDVDKVNALIKQTIQPIEFMEMRLELRPVFGIAVAPEHGVDAVSLLRHAQVAADSAEAFERHLSYYKPEYDQYNARRLMLVSELKDAIKNDHLSLYFQPKYNIKAQTFDGAEALVRWNHPRYGLVRPDEFIEIAEQTGIIRPLTRWVATTAFAQQQKFKEAGFDLNISINISALNLREADLISFLKDQQQVFGFEPSSISIELTETSMMAHPLDAIEVLQQISDLGMKVSIDDFGAGYSSLAYLRSLPASEIKIDKSLVFGICNHEGDRIIAQTAITMCHKLGFTVVAEGVENEPTLDRLKALSCDSVQGYYFTPPLPFEKLVDWLTDYERSQRDVS